MTYPLLRLFGPLALAILTAVAIRWSSKQRSLVPPLFVSGPGSSWRSMAGLVVVAGVLYLGVLQPLASLGLTVQVPESIRGPELFLIHAMLVAALLTWFVLGFVSESGPLSSLRRQFGLKAEKIWQEILVGFLAGVVGWFGVMAVTLLISSLTLQLGGEGLLPTEAPKMVVLIAGLPWALKVLISLSAGVVEEVFFRGFLQPRIGILFSTVLFSVGHLSYDQPWMLVGITLLSFYFAFLVRWRQNLWSAITAHAVFDGIQLLLLVPMALELAGG